MSSKVKFGICEWVLPETPEGTIALASKMGYEGMVLEGGRANDGFPISQKAMQQDYMEKALDYDITLTTLALSELCHTTMCDSANYGSVTEIFDIMIDTAYAMGINLLQVPSFHKGFIRTEDDFINTAKCIKYACKRAQDSGIIIGTENNLDAKGNLRILETVSEENLKIYFDTANPFYLCGDIDAPELLTAVKDHLCEVHAKDVNYRNVVSDKEFVPLGTGEVKLKESMDIIKASDYSGWIHNENEYSISKFTEDLDILKQMFDL